MWFKELSKTSSHIVSYKKKLNYFQWIFLLPFSGPKWQSIPQLGTHACGVGSAGEWQLHSKEGYRTWSGKMTASLMSSTIKVQSFKFSEPQSLQPKWEWHACPHHRLWYGWMRWPVMWCPAHSLPQLTSASPVQQHSPRNWAHLLFPRPCTCLCLWLLDPEGKDWSGEGQLSPLSCL
jgi:hypothetical protein